MHMIIVIKYEKSGTSRGNRALGITLINKRKINNQIYRIHKGNSYNLI